MLHQRPQVLKSLSLALSAGLLAVLAGQACGEFSPATAVNRISDQAANSDNDEFSIIALSSSLYANTALQFNYSGRALGPNATIIWSHGTSTSGLCVENSGSSSPIYSLTCDHAGTVTISLQITVDGKTYGPYSADYSVLAALPPGATPAPTPTPDPAATPTPTPAPAALTGVELYNNNCLSCHGAIAVSTERGTTVIKIQNAINESKGNMGQFKGIFTTSELQKIADALK